LARSEQEGHKTRPVPVWADGRGRQQSTGAVFQHKHCCARPPSARRILSISKRGKQPVAMAGRGRKAVRHGAPTGPELRRRLRQVCPVRRVGTQKPGPGIPVLTADGGSRIGRSASRRPTSVDACFLDSKPRSDWSPVDVWRQSPSRRPLSARRALPRSSASPPPSRAVPASISASRPRVGMSRPRHGFRRGPWVGP